MPDAADRLRSALADRYRIERELGAGGMATVYLAHDLRHEREVAIKLLHPDLGAALGAERFLSEIRTTARLQHPHILPLLDSGDAGGLLYYVMPRVTGETLRARLVRERVLPIAEAVRIATEVASALDYAHRQGVVHRDIKPENILLQDGSALVADFGIALAVQQAGGQRMTQTGLSLGTPSYMSPEQAMGEKAIDARSDIYALGAVTYELLTGEPPFTGGSVQAIVAKVLTERPTPIRTVRDTVPAPVEHAVLTALAKLPADRFATAKAFADALAATHRPAEQPTTALPARAPARPRSRLPWAIAALALAAAAVAVAALLGRDPERPVTQYPVALLEPGRDMFVRRRDRFPRGLRVALSPDGASIAYRVDSAGARLHLKARDQRTGTPLAGTEGAESPAFSPDGAWIAFASPGGVLRKVRVSGGGAVQVADGLAADRSFIAWLDDQRLAFLDRDNALREVPAAGGTTTVLHDLGDRRLDGLSPLPDGRGLLLNICIAPCPTSQVELLVPGTPAMRRLLDDALGAWHSPSGHLLFVSREGVLSAVPFDLAGGRITGGPFAVLDGVRGWQVAVSASGDALYTQGGAWRPHSELVWVARSGTATPVDSTWRERFTGPALAPDGATIAVAIEGVEGTDLWLRRPGTGPERLAAQRGLLSWRPSWTDGGRAVAYVRMTRNADSVASGELWRTAPDGGNAEMLLPGTPAVWEAELTRDGAWIAYRINDRVISGSIFARRVRGDTIARPVVQTPADERMIALAPDGRWMAFTSDVTGVMEVYVVAFPSGAARNLVSRGGGTMPRWRADGRELYYAGPRGMMAVPITSRDGALVAGEPVSLFPTGAYELRANRQEYDVTPDGQRFLLVRPLGSRGDAPLVHVQNLAALVRRKAQP